MATIQQNNMENVQEESDQSRPRLSSRYLSSVKLQPKRKYDLNSNESTLQEHRANNTENISTRTVLNGYANHISDSQDSNSEDEDKIIDNTNNHISNSDNDDDDDDIDADDDDDNDDDEDDDDDDDDDDYDENYHENCEIEYNGATGDNNSDDDINSYDGDDDSNKGDCVDNINTNQSTSYSCADENSVKLDKDVESLTEGLNVSLQVSARSGNDEETSNTGSIDSKPISSNSDSNNTYVTSRGNAHNEDNLRSTEHEQNINKSKNGDKRESLAAGSRILAANNSNTSVSSGASNATSLGARPKILSPNPALFNTVEPNYHNGEIPSLETTGIDKAFLARHTTDLSLPHSSFTESYDMPAGDSHFMNWPQTSTASNSSSSSWSLPRPPAPERSEFIQESAYSRGVNPWYGDPSHVGYQPVTPMTSSISGQLSNKHQLHTEQLSSAVDWFNRQSSMPSNRYQPNFSGLGDFAARNGPTLNLPAVNPMAPDVGHPSVTLPNSPRVNFPTTTSQYSSSTISGSVASTTSPLNVFSGNGQDHVGDFTWYRSSDRVNQENIGLISSEIGHSGRPEERLRNYDPFNIPQESSISSALPEDSSLVALERKVAEACAVVERVLKEREERTKKQREAAQRHKEMREQRQREARERKEREEREIREREEREMREREEREMREREERENRERAEREMRERSERETREREDRTAEENLSVQETPVWQCEHYQRRCSVKFPCCGQFYPCHRCHNLSGACHAEDKKANQATHVKCGNCGHQEEVSIFSCSWNFIAL